MDAPCQGQNWLSENRPYLEMLDTDPGFIRIGLSGESESEPEVGAVCGRDGGDGRRRKVAKFSRKNKESKRLVPHGLSALVLCCNTKLATNVVL